MASTFEVISEDERAQRLMLAIIVEALPAEEVEKVMAEFTPEQRLDLVDVMTEFRTRLAGH